MLKEVENLAQEFLENTKNKRIRVISHYDTDGITSASIITKTLKRLDKKFSVRIVKGLEEETIKKELARNGKEIILFCDLASGSLNYFQNLSSPIFIIDHHEINKELLNDKIRILNPHLTDNPEDNDCTGSELCYLFSRAISPKNVDLAKLAIIGLIGDRHETNLSRLSQQIINDNSDLTIKKGIVLYPATKPLRRTLEYCTSPYIPGVTGSSLGVMEILRETGIPFEKSLFDLSDEETSKLITSIIIRRTGMENENILGNLYLLKFFNTKEDVREISVLVNACSRLGNSDIAILYCLENENAKVKALEIYDSYRQELVSGLRFAEKMEKIVGNGFVILNAKDQIKDVIVGTICSMLSSSRSYKEGTILIGMAYNEDKIKVSARIVGKDGKNLKEILEKTVMMFKQKFPTSTTEVGGHHYAAGCSIEKEREESFIEELKKTLVAQ